MWKSDLNMYGAIILLPPSSYHVCAMSRFALWLLSTTLFASVSSYYLTSSSFLYVYTSLVVPLLSSHRKKTKRQHTLATSTATFCIACYTWYSKLYCLSRLNDQDTIHKPPSSPMHLIYWRRCFTNNCKAIYHRNWAVVPSAEWCSTFSIFNRRSSLYHHHAPISTILVIWSLSLQLEVYRAACDLRVQSQCHLPPSSGRPSTITFGIVCSCLQHYAIQMLAICNPKCSFALHRVGVTSDI